MRIALLSPYSWTYPGGVTRHVEALAAELAALGHDARILAPFDPDDALSRHLHRGARPQRLDPPAGFVPLGRTAGFPANGAVSNLVPIPPGVLAMRRELRKGGYDVVHIHEPVVPLLGWDALCSTAPELPLVGTFHTYSENALTNGIANALGARRRMNHLHVRIAVSEAAAWTARRFYGGRYRIVPNGVQLDEAQAGDGALDADTEAGAPLRILFIGQAVERKGLPVLLRAFEALREQVPATLTLVGADAEEVAHMMLDDRGVHALGKVSEARKHAELADADVLCAPSLHGESFGMVLTEALAARTPVIASDIPGYRDVVRDGIEGVLTAPGDALALAEALRSLALDPTVRTRMAADAAPARGALRLAARRRRGARLLRAGSGRRPARHARRPPWGAPRPGARRSLAADPRSTLAESRGSARGRCRRGACRLCGGRLGRMGRASDRGRGAQRASARCARCVVARWWLPRSAASCSRCSRSCTSASAASPKVCSPRVRDCSSPAWG